MLFISFLSLLFNSGPKNPVKNPLKAHFANFTHCTHLSHFGLFFAVIVILVQLPCGNFSICPHPIRVRLTEPHGVISTPNFPNKFNVPFCYHWVIDSQRDYIRNYDSTGLKKNGRVIRVFLTQVYLQENFTIVEYEDYSFNDDDGNDHKRADVSYNDTSKLSYATKYKYLAIEVELTSGHGLHYRARNWLDVYGFNITYDIVDERVHDMDFGKRKECSLGSCSSLGNCLVTSDYRSFYCSCLKRRYGEWCEYSDRCDPNRNISFCENGATCKMHGPSSGLCFCAPGFTGPYCQNKIENSVIECPGSECKELCNERAESLHRPCSCHNRKFSPEGSLLDWKRYEVTLQASHKNLPNWDSRVRNDSLSPKNNLLKEEIERGIENILKNSNQIHINTTVTIVAFGPASKFSFQFFGPKESKNLIKTLEEVLLKSTISPQITGISSHFELTTYPPLALKSLTKRTSSNQMLKMGQDFSLTCLAEGSRRVAFKWFKENITIDSSLASRRIYENFHSQEKSYTSTSILMFDSATEADKGVFTCQVSDMGEEKCQSINIDIISPPIVDLEPKSLTLQKGDVNVCILCTAENENRFHNFSYIWTKNGAEISAHDKTQVIEPLSPYGSLLRILKAHSSLTYTCNVKNLAGKTSSSSQLVVVDSSHSPSCRPQVDNWKLNWPRTSPGQVAQLRCPPGSLGFVQRPCVNTSPNSITSTNYINYIKSINSINNVNAINGRGGGVRWDLQDFSQCTTRQLRDMNKTMQNLKMGFANRTQVSRVNEKLLNYLNNKTILHVGECEKIVKLLEEIGNFAMLKKDYVLEREKEETNFIYTFFTTVNKLLTFPSSCTAQKTVLTLSNLIHRISMEFKTVTNWESDSMIVQKFTLFYPIVVNKIRLPSLNRKEVQKNNNLEWADASLEINMDNSRTNNNTEFLFIIYRNLTQLYYDRPFDLRSPYELISPIISFTSPHFIPSQTSIFQLFFDLSPPVAHSYLNERINLSCGGLDDELVESGEWWKSGVCYLKNFIQNKTIECECEHFGTFGLLSITNHIEEEEESFELGGYMIFSTVILIVLCLLTILLIMCHLNFHLASKSSYSLKIVLSLSTLLSHLFILSLRTECGSLSLSTSLSTLFILSLSTLLSSNIYIFFSSTHNPLNSQPNKNTKFTLSSLSKYTLLLCISLPFCLPIWTTSVALTNKNSNNYANSSVLEWGAPLFIALFGMVGILEIAFLASWVSGRRKLVRVKGKMDEVKQHGVEYRLKTLNRSLILMICILFHIFTGISYINNSSSPVYQNLYSTVSIIMGIVLLVCFTIWSEYPFPGFFLLHFPLCSSSHFEVPDPEKIPYIKNRSDKNGAKNESGTITPEKHLENGCPASTILLTSQNIIDSPRVHRSRLRTLTFDSMTSGRCSESGTAIETFGSSSVFSSNSRRNSFAIKSGGDKPQLINNGVGRINDNWNVRGIPRSLTSPPHFNNCGRRNRPLYSLHHHHHTDFFGSHVMKPEKVPCLLSEIESSEYVLPSLHKLETLSSSQNKSFNNNSNGYILIDSSPKNDTADDLGTFVPKKLLLPEGLYESIPSPKLDTKETRISPIGDKLVVRNGVESVYKNRKAQEPLPPPPKPNAKNNTPITQSTPEFNTNKSADNIETTSYAQSLN